MKRKWNVAMFALLFAAALLFAGSGRMDVQAASVSWGGRYAGTISKADDRQEYQVNLSSAGRIQLAFTGEMSRVWISIEDASGKAVWGREEHKEGTENYSIDLTKGAYTLVVEQYSSYIGDYDFSMSFTSANESFSESNNTRTIASKPTLGTRVNGQIACNDEMDVYKYTLSSAGRITLTLTSEMPTVWISVENASGDRVWGRDDAKEGTTTYAIDLTAGTYYVTVDQYSSYTGNYNYLASFSSAGESFAEPNNSPTYASAPLLGSTVNGQIASNDEEDVYKYVFSSDKKLTLQMNNTMQVRVYLTDASGDRVWGSETPKAGSTAYEIEVSAGTYYLYVEQYGSYTGTYSFALSEYVAPPQPQEETPATTVKPKKTQISQVKSSGSRKIVIVWKIKADVAGYQIQCSPKKNFKKGTKTYLIKGTKKSSKVIKKLKAKKKYFVRIRSFTKVKVNGKTKKVFSAWSKVQKVKVRK